MSRRRPIALLTLLAAIGFGTGSVARAQPAPGSAAAAEALFQEGRALLMAGKVDDACPKLEESQRLDPATGTLLALALCHEQQGKLASAWAAFADIEARSRLDGRADRERTAREHGAALRPRLSTLTLAVSADAADTPGLVISVDGVPIGRPAWNAALPVDGGAHVVEAAVPGRAPWRTSVAIQRERDQVRLAVLVPPPPAEAALSHAGSTSPGRGGRSFARRVVALSAVGAALAGLGASVLLALDARSDYRAARVQCTEAGCPDQPYRRAQDARSQGNLASILAITGGALAAGGVALWFWPQSANAGSEHARPGLARVLVRVNARVNARVDVGPQGVAISGRF